MSYGVNLGSIRSAEEINQSIVWQLELQLQVPGLKLTLRAHSGLFYDRGNCGCLHAEAPSQ